MIFTNQLKISLTELVRFMEIKIYNKIINNFNSGILQKKKKIFMGIMRTGLKLIYQKN